MESGASSTTEAGGFQLPWGAIPKFIPGATDVTEYSRKLQFLAAMWPKESLHLLAPRAALLCEGTAFKKIASLPADKLKSADLTGVKLIVATLGGSWGKTQLEAKYDCFEKAIYGTIQKADETNDSYLARHDVHFEELLAQGVSLKEVRAYILLRQSQLTSEDRKKIVVEMGGTLEYDKVCSAIRLLGSRFFADLQGQKSNAKSKTYDANALDEVSQDEPERAFQATSPVLPEEADQELDSEFIEAMIAHDDQDALQVQSFEEELEGFFQETPELQEALVSYLEARTRLLQKKKSRGFWPVGSTGKGSKGGRGFKGKGKGKPGRDQLLARIARSTCRACGERGHWKAECPKYGRPGSMSQKGEATTTVAEVEETFATTTITTDDTTSEVHTSVPEEAISLDEAHFAESSHVQIGVLRGLKGVVQNLKSRREALNATATRPHSSGQGSWTEHVMLKRSPTAWVQRSRASARTVKNDCDTAMVCTDNVEAILDTGASRCVMGKRLLPKFISQLSDATRALVKVVKSAVKFRFGNNQTLISEQRILLPFNQGHQQILWLSIEIVPGGTPLLWSKKAIKQLGGVIDTNEDVCHLTRLQKSLHLRTGPTGLYLVDLARLCEESGQEQQCQTVTVHPGATNCDDRYPEPTCTPSRKHAFMSQSSQPSVAAPGCIEFCKAGSSDEVGNSETTSFRKYPETDNDSPQEPKSSSACTMLLDETFLSCPAATDCVKDQVEVPTPAASSFARHHGRPFRAQRATAQPWCPIRQVVGPNSEVQLGRHSQHVAARAGEAHDKFRTRHEGADLRVCRGKRAGLDEMDVRAHVLQSQALPSGFSPLCGKIYRPCGTARSCSLPGFRGHRARSCAINSTSQAQGVAQESSGSRGRSRESRPVGHGVCNRGRGTAARQPSELLGQPHDSNGACHAASAGSHPADLRSPAERGSLVRSEQPEPYTLKKALVDRLRVDAQAQELYHRKPSLDECLRFLRTVPWHQLQGSRDLRTQIEKPSQESAKPTAYLCFGMYMHGGIVGVTNVTKRHPWLTRLLCRVLRLTNVKHRFTSIGVSCNASALPHRDKYSDPLINNLVVPLQAPRKGGAIWVNLPPSSPQQAVVEMECNGERKEGHLVSLKKGAVFIHPHTLHETTAWEGDRLLEVGYALKYANKLSTVDTLWLRKHGFVLPSLKADLSSSKGLGLNVPEPSPPSEMRQTLTAATAVLAEPSCASAVQSAAVACQDALCKAEQALQESQLMLSPPGEPGIDLLEVTNDPDSRLTQVIQDHGGKARRYILQRGHLTTGAQQQELWDLVHQLQPRHIWVAPDMRNWCSWSSLNAARSTQSHQRVAAHRAEDQGMLKVVKQLLDWQKRHHRHLHVEISERSRIEEVPELKEVIKEAFRSTVDMCSFGLRTPVSDVPIRKRTVIFSTCRELTKSFAQKMCTEDHEHHRLAGRSLKGQPLSRFAGTFCQGFARHVATQMLCNRPGEVCATDEVVPMTRKRFKTSVGTPQTITQIGAQKRANPESPEGSSRSKPKPRTELSPAPCAQLPMLEWKPVCERAAQCTSHAAHTLVPAQSELVQMLQDKLGHLQILQVFVSRKVRTLQSPLGAVPATVAPIRISLGCKISQDSQMSLECLGNENRTTMLPERKRMRIGVFSFLITILGHRKSSTEEPRPGMPPTESAISDSQSFSPSNPNSAEAGPTRPDLEGWAPPPVPLHGPAFRNLDKEAKTQLIRVHNNLGHPAPQTLAQHLKAAGESPSMVQAALDYQCDACLESTEPRHQRPGKLPSSLEFNDLIGVDGFFFKGQSGYRAYVVHSLDEASCFHLGRRVENRQSVQAIRSLSDFWMSWAGNPKKIYLDPAGEFRSEEILDRFQTMNIRTFVTAAAWQRGKLERHGDIVKDMLRRLDLQSPLANDDLFDQALLQAFQAKNALVRHQGYAPEQIVLGKSLRVPGSLSSDEDLSSHVISAGEDLEAEMHRRRLDLRCQARKVFWDADNCQTIRRAMLRRSNPQRGPYHAGDWVLYWLSKSSPNRLAAGRWHGPAKVITQEGQSIVWVSHGTTILRCAPENLRPASLREWQQLSNLEGELPTKNTGGASTFVDLTQPNAPVISGSAPSDLPEAVTTVPAAPSVEGPRPSEEEIPQPEQEMTPQVSISPEGLPAAPQEVEREPAGSVAPAVFPSADASSFESRSAPDPGDSLDATQIPVPDSEDGLQSEQVFLACQSLDSNAEDSLQTFMTLQASTEATGPLLAEDELPYVESPLCCSEHQAFCLEIPLKAKDMKRWSRESSPEQLATIAAASKRARAEVHLKDLTPAEVKLFDEAKQKEIQCWIQTSAIRAVLRQKLNPEQILKSRWILTWKSPEPGESHRRAKARLVVLGFQDPKLVDVMRDAPTLSKEGRALVLQTIASCKFQLGSFDIKTAFLRGKADASNPLAMEPPRELRQALGLQEEEVCQLLGNAYGRVDAPLLFYKELSKQLHELGFVRHPLEPCVFLLYTGQTLNGILGVHVDDGVCGGDDKFLKKIQALQAKLPFGSRKFQSFVFTGIHLEQFPDFSIRASQAEYVKNIQQIDIGRSRRLTPDNPVTESERSKLRGLVGSLQYAVTHTRPDMAAKLGEVQGQITQATVQSLLLANKILRETQENANVCIYFLSIRPSDLTFVSFGDASFASSKNLSSHQGALVFATDGRLNKNVEAPVSPLTWTSKKIPRVVRSTLSAEAYAMSKAVDMLGWIRALWGVVHVPSFSWQRPEEGFQQLNQAIIVTDCKSLFDLVTRLAMPACEEHRTTLEVLLIKQRCGENTCFRWVPTTLQAADCLTKSMDASLLRAVLSVGRFKLFDTSQSLEKDAQRRQAIEWLSKPSTVEPQS